MLGNGVCLVVFLQQEGLDDGPDFLSEEDRAVSAHIPRLSPVAGTSQGIGISLIQMVGTVRAVPSPSLCLLSPCYSGLYQRYSPFIAEPGPILVL